jgi:hypothetical protein
MTPPLERRGLLRTCTDGLSSQTVEVSPCSLEGGMRCLAQTHGTLGTRYCFYPGERFTLEPRKQSSFLQVLRDCHESSILTGTCQAHRLLGPGLLQSQFAIKLPRKRVLYRDDRRNRVWRERHWFLRVSQRVQERCC